MDETNEDYVVNAGSETEIDQSEDEEVVYKGRIITKRRQTSKSPGYQRRERFLSGRHFVEHPYFREFATGPSPAVKDRDDPRAFFYCRMCKIDISTDKTFSRTPANLVWGHFKRDKHYLKDVKYRASKGVAVYRKDGTRMTFYEVAQPKDTFDNIPPIIPDNHLYPLVGQSPTKKISWIYARRDLRHRRSLKSI